VLSLLSCGRAPAEAATTAPARTEPSASDRSIAPVPHGDHSPRHGGTVWMYKDVHFEVVFDPSGHHRIYFSDAIRQDLPASVAAQVTVTVVRPQEKPEAIQGSVDSHGESWLVEGAPVRGDNLSARVAFTIEGDPYWIDMPLKARR
jgi:hypothetical protein